MISVGMKAGPGHPSKKLLFYLSFFSKPAGAEQMALKIALSFLCMCMHLYLHVTCSCLLWRLKTLIHCNFSYLESRLSTWITDLNLGNYRYKQTCISQEFTTQNCHCFTLAVIPVEAWTQGMTVDPSACENTNNILQLEGLLETGYFTHFTTQQAPVIVCPFN